MKTGTRVIRSTLGTVMGIGLLFMAVAPAAAVPQAETIASGFSTATALAVDGSGNVFVGEGDQSGSNSVARVSKFDSAGVRTLQFGTPGAGPGQMNLPYAIALDGSGNIYVAENYGNRLQKFDSSGTFVSVLASVGTPSGGCADGTVHQAAGVAVYGSSVFVSSHAGNCVQKISTSGVFQAKWGSSGGGNGQFGGPSAVAVDSLGYVYVADSSRVQKFDASGNFVLSWSGSNGGYGMTIDRNDNIYVALDGDECRRIEKRSSSGVLLGSACGGDFSRWGGANTKLASDSDGRLYISNGTAVVRIDPTVPKAALSGPTASVLTGAAVVLDASASSVAFGSVARYEWDLNGDGSFERDGGSSATLTTSFAAAGGRTVSVKVAAPGGKTAVASINIEARLAPPSGEPGVSINDGAQFTNDPNVLLWPVWPAGGTAMRVSNDGGFRHAQTLALGETAPWALVTSGEERLPKTIYVRFSGSGIDEARTYQDDIILDQTPPKIVSATAMARGARASEMRADMAKRKKTRARTVRVRIKATDALSGVGKMQVTDSKQKPGAVRAYAVSATLRTTKKAIFVRAQDRAGNWSAWRSVRVKAKSAR